MKKPYILIVTQNYYPEPLDKMHILAKALVANNYKVAVLTTFPNYPHGRITHNYRQKLWLKEIIDGVTIFRTPIIPDHSKSITRRLISYLSFAISASVVGVFLVGKPDIIHVYYPPLSTAWPARFVGLLKKSKITAELIDMWPEVMESTGIVRSKKILGLINSLMKKTYGWPDRLIATTPGFKKNLIGKQVSSGKIAVIPNWGSEDLIRPEKPDRLLIKKYKSKNRFLVVYAGNIGPAQNIENIAKAARILKDEKLVYFLIVGSGADQESLAKLVSRYKLKNFTMIGSISKKDISKYYSIADILLIHLKADSVFKMYIPGKTQDVMLAGKPIIACIEGDSADIITNAKAGLTVAPGDPKSLAQVVDKMSKLPKLEREIMGQNALNYYNKYLSQKIALAKYLKIFNDLIK